MTFSEFKRRYLGLVAGDQIDGSLNDKQLVESILSSQGVEFNSFKVGRSQAFFRVGTLARLDRQVEDTSHDTMVLFQVRRGLRSGPLAYMYIPVQLWHTYSTFTYWVSASLSYMCIATCTYISLLFHARRTTLLTSSTTVYYTVLTT